jgi:miniconductance mechanosensitive channel
VGADAFVIDIALHTVKVQNWDKTITTIPTWRLMSDSYKNWRGMFESGGRRIRRSLYLDAHTIGLLTPGQRQKLSSLELLKDHWTHNGGLRMADAPAGSEVAAQQLSNLAAFKAYAYAYLLRHPHIHKTPNMFLLVRTMEPSPMGVPLELFCYTSTTVWVEYEAIQGAIFDHLIGMLPLFGLSLYQRSSDHGQHLRLTGGERWSEGQE